MLQSPSAATSAPAAMLPIEFGGVVLINLTGEVAFQAANAAVSACHAASVKPSDPAVFDSQIEQPAVAAPRSKGESERLKLQLLWRGRRIALNRPADGDNAAALEVLKTAPLLIYVEPEHASAAAKAAISAKTANAAESEKNKFSAPDLECSPLWFSAVLNPPLVTRVSVRYKLFAELCIFLWLFHLMACCRQYADATEPAGYGPVFIPRRDDVGRSLQLEALVPSLPQFGQKASLGKVLAMPEGDWHRERMQAFRQQQQQEDERRNSQEKAAFRVVSFNLLAEGYAQTPQAESSMYCSCPAPLRRFVHRAPLLGRELLQLDADIYCLQEWCVGNTVSSPSASRAFVCYCDGIASLLICLRSSVDCFTDLLCPLLQHFGYSGILSLKDKTRRVQEGCALFYRKSRFSLLQTQALSISQQLAKHAMFKELRASLSSKWPDLLERLMPQLGTVLQLTALRDIKNETVPPLLIANTHLFFHPRASHVRILQVYAVCRLLSELITAPPLQSASLVLCGDFNCDADSGGHRLLTNTKISHADKDWEHGKSHSTPCPAAAVVVAEPQTVGVCGRKIGAPTQRLSEGSLSPTYSWDEQNCDEEVLDSETAAAANSEATATADATAAVEGLSLELPPSVHLKDCYAATPLPFTNFVCGFQAALDHVFVSKELHVVGTLPGVSFESVDAHGGLLCEFYPSDHLSIAADLQYKQ
ncbi:endonuclease exonuclease phosphatase domain-containing protein [Cyclospora cayetanensis]|uniref:Endonuclease exonuclease phosphatase domain-containing protein n=1 Tax=Cyclospora cayetanensis TaxID=88456 RepID=A0A1D3CR21_9EIME|nr:endonuclease exonuclease phosphatase domain-containing protein [Cyclospora cayetanensis]